MSTGYPHPQIEKGMEDEHCEESFGCNVEFTTSNYGITTTPKREYEIACDPEKCQEDHKMDKERTKSIRNVKKISELVELDIAKKAELELYEVKAIVSVFHFEPHCTVCTEFRLGVLRYFIQDPCSKSTIPCYDSLRKESQQNSLNRSGKRITISRQPFMCWCQPLSSWPGLSSCHLGSSCIEGSGGSCQSPSAKKMTLAERATWNGAS